MSLLIYLSIIMLTLIAFGVFSIYVSEYINHYSTNIKIDQLHFYLMFVTLLTMLILVITSYKLGTIGSYERGQQDAIEGKIEYKMNVYTRKDTLWTKIN